MLAAFLRRCRKNSRILKQVSALLVLPVVVVAVVVVVVQLVSSHLNKIPVFQVPPSVSTSQPLDIYPTLNAKFRGHRLPSTA